MVRWVKSLKWLALGFMAASVTAGAQEQLTEGQGLPPPETTAGDRIGAKIEVIEFYSYGCPHCKDLENTSALDQESPRRRQLQAHSGGLPAGVGESGQDLLHAQGSVARTCRAKVFSSLHGAGVKLNEEKSVLRLGRQQRS